MSYSTPPACYEKAPVRRESFQEAVARHHMQLTEQMKFQSVMRRKGYERLTSYEHDRMEGNVVYTPYPQRVTHPS